jgi:hypothetical protein
MTTPITLPQLDELTLTELRRRYEEGTTRAERERSRRRGRADRLARDRTGFRTPIGQDTANWTTERLGFILRPAHRRSGD